VDTEINGAQTVGVSHNSLGRGVTVKEGSELFTGPLKNPEIGNF
jgi:hypothetical protein